MSRSVVLNTKELNECTNRQEIIDYVKNHAWNGQYVYQVCMNCGNYLTAPDAKTDNIEIKNHCFKCID